MAETFQCPQCGKDYPRENRLVGKAVACECGRRFLVPPREAPAASSASASSLAVPAPPVAQVASPAAPRRALPAAKAAPAQPARAKPARWADPVPQEEVIPLTEADLVDESGQSAASPTLLTPAIPPMAIPVGGGNMAYPVDLAPAERPLPPVRYKPPATKPTKRKRKRESQDTAAAIGMWVAGFVFLFSLLPACIVLLWAMINYSKHGMFG